jgi:AraC-like DNA-binding protein
MNQRQPFDREPPPVGSSVVHSVLLVGAYDHSGKVQFEASSLPGHLIQLMRTGMAAHQVGGRKYIISPGDLLWYHEDEQMVGEVLETPWSWYSVNFIAPTLPPPPFEHRVRRANPAAYQHFADLLEAWLDTDVDPALREIRVHARLLTLLADIEGEGGVPFRMDASARLWWEIEGELRRDLSQPVTLYRMVEMSGRSAMTISRACHEAVGLPPLKRIKQVKMSLARGLVRSSDLRMGEIAARIGYSRVHEFSRDYHRHFDTTPTSDRATAE